ncbi:MAG: hypothetical protein Q9216_002638 [Gyalolechia sp. 2 TL-2023]
MSRQLRVFFERRLSLSQWQEFWQRTLTSGQTLKQALSSRLSPKSATFPSTRNGNELSQETYLPVFHEQASSDSFPASDKDPQAAPSADRPIQTYTNIDPGNPQMESSSGFLPTPLYTNAATQTNTPTPQSSPETAHTSELADTQSEVDSWPSPGEDQKRTVVGDDQEAGSAMGISVSDNDDAPQVYDGQSQILVTEYDGKNCLTLLLTKEMIKDLDEITEEGDKLRRLEARLEKADLKVQDAIAEISYCKSLLETADSQEEIDDLQGDIARHQTTLPRDEKRRDTLKKQLEIVKRNVVYLEELSRDAFRENLANAGLLKTPNEDVDAGNDEEDDEASQSAASPIELIPDEFEQWGNVQERSIASGDSHVSLEKLNRRAASEDLRDRFAELCQAEREFEGRYDDYEEQKANFQHMLLLGTCNKSMTWFDHLNIRSTQQLTRKLVVAEEAYEDAYARRRKIGPNQYDQESGFLSTSADGSAMSLEDEGFPEPPNDRVYAWLDNVPDVENPPDISELEDGAGMEFGQKNRDDVEVSSIRSAQMSDGWSCQDFNTRNRKRIDRWRKIAGRVK